MEQLSSPGRLIGKGNTAEVYQYDAHHIIKLYTENFGEDLALYEQKVLGIVNRAGAPSPLVGGLVQCGSRYGLKMELVEGSTLDRLMAREPAQLAAHARLMAALHARIHAVAGEGLQNGYQALSDRIRTNTVLLGGRAGAVLDCLGTLPSGDRLCHGDAHPKNILAGPLKSTVIDWTNAYNGNPLSDVTLTRLRLLSPYIPKDFAGDGALFLAAKKLVYEAYINEYTKLTGVSDADLQPWLIPCAAAQLHPLKTVHTEWLLGLIG